MKKTLPLFILLFLNNIMQAQDYTPLEVSSGYNADVIADGLNPASVSTTMAMDNADFVFMTADYQATEDVTPPEYGLPVSGTVESSSTPGLSYQFGPYYDNNSVRLQEQDDYGFLTFSNQVNATKIYIMASSGSGQASFTGSIYFSDNTSQEITATVVPDWFYSNLLPVIVSGFGRVNRLTDAVENPFGNPRLYQIEIAILPENQAKNISSVDFYKSTAAEGVINIFAVSAELLPTCPDPTDLQATTTETSATVSWSAAPVAPAGGYDYYYSTDETEPAESQNPTGNLSSGTLSLTIPNLATGQEYYFWIRSNCGANDKGNWTLINFATGQISFTYPDGDINTLYSDTTVVTPDFENSCPGLLYVDVPAGYQIASTATSYQMQTASNGWMSEQRSLLVCNTTGLSEATVTSGIGGNIGTYSYFRDGIDIANGATGTVEFELRAWRTYGGADCNMTFNRVIGDTWTVTITYSPLLSVNQSEKNTFTVYPNPAHDLLHISGNDMISEIRLFNLLGQEVVSKAAVNDKQLQLNTSGLAKGTYLLKIFTDNGVKSMSILKD